MEKKLDNDGMLVIEHQKKELKLETWLKGYNKGMETAAERYGQEQAARCLQNLHGVVL